MNATRHNGGPDGGLRVSFTRRRIGRKPGTANGKQSNGGTATPHKVRNNTTRTGHGNGPTERNKANAARKSCAARLGTGRQSAYD